MNVERLILLVAMMLGLFLTILGIGSYEFWYPYDCSGPMRTFLLPTMVGAPLFTLGLIGFCFRRISFPISLLTLPIAVVGIVCLGWRYIQMHIIDNYPLGNWFTICVMLAISCASYIGIATILYAIRFSRKYTN